jgi:hypothetical protein
MRNSSFGIGVSSVVLSVLLACNTAKKAAESLETKSIDGTGETIESRVIGTIEMNETCGCLIRVIQGDVEHTYQPTNLDPRLKTTGVKIQFAFKQADLRSPAECPDVIPIILSNVTPIR